MLFNFVKGFSVQVNYKKEQKLKIFLLDALNICMLCVLIDITTFRKQS